MIAEIPDLAEFGHRFLRLSFRQVLILRGNPASE
jgi:hypothetical protein